ncbi:MAG: rhamnosyltransferase WsaF family glycosyltransferase [Acidithiobacillus sp.]
MTTEKEARQHLYSRPPLDSNAEDSLAKIAHQITPGAAVLDIGCAVGELGHYLTEQKHCVVDGIEANPDAAAIARSFNRQVWEADLETASLAELLGESRYQYIVCADVLEHLRDPGQLIRQIANFLTPGGKLLVSIPNIAHVGVFLELLSGDFRYREEGLLDQTHLRFFTRRSFLYFLAENGFAGQIVDRTIVDLQHSEFSAIPLEIMSPSLLREMQDWDDNITYQFIVEAYPQEIGENVTPIFPLDKAVSHGPRFACQVFWRSNDEPFTETRSERILLPIGVGRQRVDFNLPKGLVQSLRFDPSGQKGFLRLYAMRLYNGADCLWTWDGNIETLLRGTLHSIFPAPLKNGEEGVVLSILDEDPWLELPLPTEILSSADHLEVELSWPMSADYLAVQEAGEDLLKQNQRLATELEAMQQASQVRTGELTAALQAAEEQNQRLATELESTQQSGQTHASELTAALQAAEEQNQRLATELEATQQASQVRAGELTAALQAAEEQNQRLATELEATQQASQVRTGELTAALQAAEEQNQCQSRELEDMRGSRSWRITLPMRVVVTRFRNSARTVGLSLRSKRHTRTYNIARKIYHVLPLRQDIKKRLRSKVIHLLPTPYTSENVGHQAGIPHLAPRADDYSLVVPFGFSVETWENTPRIAVICHLFYTDLADEIRGYLENIPFPFDLIVTTDDPQKVNAIENAFSSLGRGNLEIRIAPNRGRDIAPKLITCKDVYDHYEYILYIHTKKSPHEDILYSWRNHLLENLIGSKEIVESIFEMFRANKSLGMVAPSHFNAIKHAIGWGWNTIEVKKIAARMGIMIREEGRVDFPSGSMFWTRSCALKPLLELGFTIEDFPPEGGQIDGTLAHVIERIFFLSCERAGYQWYFITTSPSAAEKERVRYVNSKKDLLDFMEKYRYELLEPIADGLYQNIISLPHGTPSIMATLDEHTSRQAYKNSGLSKLKFSDFQQQLELFLSNQESMIDFDEQFYLTVNRDVAQAVMDGASHCGYIHFLISGRLEERLWSNRQLQKRFNLTPSFPEGFFAPANVSPLIDYKPIVHLLSNDCKRTLLIMVDHLQEDLFFAGYAEFFRDLWPEYEKFEKIYVSVENVPFDPSLVMRHANNIEVIRASRIKEIKHVPQLIICHNSRLFTKAKKMFVDMRNLVYYCQDYEAGFFPYSSNYVEAERAIFDAPHLIISTEILRSFFEERKLLQRTQHIFVTSPKIEIFEVLPEKSRKIFFYFRPEKFNSRNLSEILMAAAIKFAENHSGYELYLVGSVETRFSVEINGNDIFVINKLPKDEYLRLISSCDVVVACIYSAHPGVIAYQAAASGIPTVTNVFRNRTVDLLKEISENIIPYDPIRDDLVERIEEALCRPKGNKSFRQDLYSGKQEGTLSEFVNGILSCAVEQ